MLRSDVRAIFALCHRLHGPWPLIGNPLCGLPMRLALVLLLTICGACTQGQDAALRDSPPVVVGPDELLRSDGAVEGWADLAATASPNITVSGVLPVRVTVSAEGEPIAADPLRDFGAIVTPSAVRTAMELEYRPATRDGEPTEGEVVVRVIYQIK